MIENEIKNLILKHANESLKACEDDISRTTDYVAHYGSILADQLKRREELKEIIKGHEGQN